MKLTLTLNSESADATEHPHALAASLLRHAAECIDRGEPMVIESQPLRDWNGNTVGTFAWAATPEFEV